MSAGGYYLVERATQTAQVEEVTEAGRDAETKAIAQPAPVPVPEPDLEPAPSEDEVLEEPDDPTWEPEEDQSDSSDEECDVMNEK